MWKRVAEGETGAEAVVWRADERTSAIAERRTAITVDEVTGTVHLAYRYPNGDTHTIVYPPAVARSIGAALIEAGILAGGMP